MTLVVRLSGALRGFAGDVAEITVTGEIATVRDALALLWKKAPALRDRVVTERDEVRRHINIFVGADPVSHRDGLATPVHPGEELFLAPAVSGG